MSAPCPTFGFIVRVTGTSPASAAELDALRDDLVETLEANGLVMTGGGRQTLEFVVSREGAQATDRDRILVLEWAGRFGRTAAIDVSDLVDLSG
ncbi:MAG: 50S ribosome-binding protein YggL [Gemmatimonadaceae bacterium]